MALDAVVLALLARDGRTFEADLAQAKAWVERFFDLREERVQAALNELKELQAVKVRYEPPDLSETFTALRTVQARSGRPPLPVEPAAAQPPSQPAAPAAETAVAAPAAAPATPASTGEAPAASGAPAPAASE